MRHPEHIKAEQERVRILDYMASKKVSNQNIREALDITKGKLSHHIKVLMDGKYIVREHLGGNNYLYTRTQQVYIPKTIEVDEEIDDTSDVLEEDTLDVVPVSPYARVVRLLKTPLDPAPRRKGGHMFSGIQSGLGLFDGA